MKIMIASDLHGDAICVEKMLEIYDRAKCEKLLLLGDILYHGPRNDLPAGYAPKKVIAMLNGMASDIIAVRGNCDAEVDEMVLDFPIHPGCISLDFNGISIIATHGHKHGPENPPNGEYDVLFYGHTHVLKIQESDLGASFINPGSLSIPKEGNPCSLAILDGRRVDIFDLDMNRITGADF